MRRISKRSGCPISCALDLLGDKWTLLIIRDLALNGPLPFGAFLKSPERIATNILSDRLAGLAARGIIEKLDDLTGSRFYGLTDSGRELIPVLQELAEWSVRHAETTGADEAVGRRNGALLRAASKRTK
jgi:DNA-binding HxlR family transcriptional regulator